MYVYGFILFLKKGLIFEKFIATVRTFIYMITHVVRTLDQVYVYADDR
jgi:hypothetical protein